VPQLSITFAQSPSDVLYAAYAEVREALAPLVGNGDVETFTEVFWSARHGLATPSRARRRRAVL
jgi:hypothetical protein